VATCLGGVAYILRTDAPASFEEARSSCQAEHSGSLAAPGSAAALDALLVWLLLLQLDSLPSLQVSPGQSWSNTTADFAPYAAGESDT
jgi:hypothetical protein